MGTVMHPKFSTSIVYFEQEGRENLSHVLRVLKRTLKKRSDLRSCTLIFFTAFGEGPALAYNMLQEFEPNIVAVTFPPDFSATRNGEKIVPGIPPKVRAFFDGVGIKVATGRLPFDEITEMPEHNNRMKLVRDVLGLFGGSFSMCIQAVLQACDFGLIRPGEPVIGVTGDAAAVITASTTKKFLSREEGLSIHEILCKPRFLTLARKTKLAEPMKEPTLFENESKNLAVTNPPLLVGSGKPAPKKPK